MVRGITGYIQANDTDLHRRLKVFYREEKINLMLKMLETDKSKIPSRDWENMIKMLMSSWVAFFFFLYIFNIFSTFFFNIFFASLKKALRNQKVRWLGRLLGFGQMFFNNWK